MALKSIYHFGPEDRSVRGQAIGAIIFERLHIPVLKAIYELGEDEFHYNIEIFKYIQERINLEDADRQKHGVRSEVEYRIQWALSNLRDAGLIQKNPAENLSWKLSINGLNYLTEANLINTDETEEIEELRKVILQLAKDNRSKKDKERRYWALGFGSSVHYDGIHNPNEKIDRLSEFVSNNYWQALDYDNEDDRASAEKARKHVMEIEIGDYAIIKGFGGRSDLVVHYLGEVDSIDPETSRIDFKKIEETFPLYKGKAPKGHGAGNWFNTILEVTRKPDINLLYYGEGEKIEIIEAINQFSADEPLNKILFGPPGTGKTYKLQKEYFEKFTTRRDAITKDQYFNNKINEYTWWEVIGAALLDLEKANVSEIADHPLIKYRTAISTSKTIRPTLWALLQAHTVSECENVNVSRQLFPLIFYKSNDSVWEIRGDIENEAPQIIELLEEFKNFQPAEGEVVKRYRFITFHQSYGYEEFIEGIKPNMPKDVEEIKDLGYHIKDGIFKEISDIARKDPKNPYAIFIDEINRGNVSNIFGELITLIEKNKRIGEANELFVDLAYSGKPFGVPPNLYIIGTMNTADRSVEALDTALRRRFTFEELLPNPEIIKSDGKSSGLIEVEDKESIDLVELLIKINKRIEVLIDRDHQIGHSFFMDVQTLKDLKDVFKDNIVPQLQEYFFGDYGKIGLVLGTGFVEKSKEDKNLFSSFKYDGKEDLNQSVYKLKEFKGMDFYLAIQELIGAPTEGNNE